MSTVLNFLLIAIILFLIIVFVMYRVFTNGKRVEIQTDIEKEHYSLENVQKIVKDEISKVTSINLYNQGYTPEEFERQNRRMKELKEALRNCNTGNINAKIYVREYIREILNNLVDYTDETVNLTIPFNKKGLLSVRDKFDILLYFYTKEHRNKGLGVLLEKYEINKLDQNDEYCFSHEQIEEIYEKEQPRLTLDDKVNIISQRIYAHYKGFGIIDEIRDMSIDGVSGGVSGVPVKLDNFDDDEALFDLKKQKHKTNGLNSVFVMYKGNTIHFDFLEFSSEAELRRVVSNVYKYNAPGQLSEQNPYIINEMADRSRVAVARPPFAESWVFLIRKKYDAKRLELETLVTHKNYEFVIALIIALMIGARTTAFTGQQGSGKTTLLMSAINSIRKFFNIRTVETAFELNLRMLYPNRNILAFQETSNITGQDALDFQKKTDGDVAILGEVATNEVASQMIHVAQVSSLFTLFSHHAKTSDMLVESIRNALVQTGAFKDEVGAERQVAEVLEFDIHLKKDMDGTRYIERITQIIPIEPKYDEIEKLSNIENDDELLKKLQILHLKKQFQTKMFKTQNIIEYRNGEYVPVHPITENKVNEMKEHMTPDEREKFDSLLAWWG